MTKEILPVGNPTPEPIIPSEDETPIEVRIEKEVDRRLEEERTRIVTETRRKFQAQLEAEIQLYKNNLETQNKELMDKVIADFKKSQEPPSAEEIQKMLDAEYIQFPVKVRWSRDARKDQPECPEEEEICLTELPASVERKVIRLLKEKAIPKLQELLPVVMDVLSGQKTDRIAAIFEIIDPTSEIVLEIVSIVLTETTGRPVSKSMIEKSMSFNRQMSILTAQVQCNRLRDFFSRAVRIAEG